MPPPKPSNFREIVKEVPVHTEKIVEMRHEVVKPFEVTKIVPQMELRIEKEVKHVI